MALSGFNLVFPMISVTKQNSVTYLTLGLDDDSYYFGAIDQVSLSSNYVVGNNILFYTKDAKVVLSGTTRYYLVSEENIIAIETAPV